jgi:two-component system, cell cycle sensor histidine kinase and response regulator CckA
MIILIVDDHEENLYLLETMLKGSGHNVLTATNGALALERLKAGDVELIISDILMPVMDGFQLCRIVKTDETLRHIPFIIYTATYTGPQDEAFAMKIGADRFIQKPCEPDIFMEAVGDVMAADRRSHSLATPEPKQEEEILRLYSERLVRKLEQKMLELEREIQMRQVVEKTLRTSEQQYRLLADNTLDIIWVMDLNLTFTYVNPAIQILMGYSPEEIIGSTLSEHCDEENFAKMAQIVADEMAEGPSGSGVVLEAVLLKKNREPIPIEIHGKVIYDENDAPILLQGTARDISERKRAEEALKESEKKYRELYDFLPIPVYEMDFEANITSVNRAIYEIFKATEEDFKRGFKGWQLLSPEEVDKSGKNIQRLLKGEKIKGTEYNLMRLDGSVFPAIVISSLIYSDGKPVRLRGAIIDITERKRQEEEIRKTTVLLDSIIENIPDMLFLKTAKDLRFVRINRAGENLIGYSKADLLGKTDFDFFPKEQASFFSENDRAALCGKTVVDIPKEALQTRNGGKRILHTKKVPLLGTSGKPEYLLGISEDITESNRAEEENKKLQAQLIQAQKMESVGRLAGGVAHDFNNMLSVIIGYSELGLETVKKEDPLYNDLKEIYDAAKRASQVTRQLLAFSRKQTIAPIVLDLNQTVENILKMLRRLIGEDINFSWNPKAGLQPVKMDPTQIDQLLANLCVNARDAINGVGKIIIETDTKVFDEAYCAVHAGFIPGNFVMLAVSDDGCGMDSETKENIFEPFFTTKDTGKGTGLGLATVYGIVKQNNGFINVYSEPGKGTTFRIYLPVSESRDLETQMQRTEEIPTGNGETVIVAEDESLILDLAEKMLNSLNYHVLLAPSPDAALRLAEKNEGRISLILTDVVMPEMSGRDLVEGLRSIYPEIKCLYMSGYTANVIAHQGVLEKGVNFLQKPFSRRDLAIKVKGALESK